MSELFGHLASLTDGIGVFEHADGTVRRLEHAYCTDDNARLLVAASRETDEGVPGRLSRVALAFVLSSIDTDGRVHNRKDLQGRWTDTATTEDCWGRAVWGLGVAASHHDDPGFRAAATDGIERVMRRRSPWPRAMAFAALGAAELLGVAPGHAEARSLLADAVVVIGVPGRLPWVWPEPRLTYANATLAEAVVAAGAALGDPRILDRGLAMLGWLLETETSGGHLSVTGTRGRRCGEPGAQFDQQPIEVAALADACWRAYTLTGQERWKHGVVMAASWFAGDNDSGHRMRDDTTGGGFDGLRADGVNTNEGAESTLALVSTVQRARTLVQPVR